MPLRGWQLFAHLPGCEFFRYTAALKVGSPRMTKLRLGGLISFVFGTILLVGSFDSTLAQVTATVSGRVEDATGASVGGAIVTVKSLETGTTRTVTTDEVGNYRVVSVGVGTQEIRGEKPGFRSAVRTGI